MQIDWQFDAIGAFVIAIYLAATSALAVYGLHLYVLVILFRRRRRGRRELQQRLIVEYGESTPDDQWPIVTSQIPMYNEAEVAERVIESVAAMDYPVGRHEIQILDDSTDETPELIDRVCRKLKREGVMIEVIRRDCREGFKAGALKNGLRTAKGEYAAVWDADFKPPSHFLRWSIPLLESNSKLACLQGRWGHLNRERSWLTRAQALGIDGHFAIEQGARAWNGLLMNFNGTAGVWRLEAIDDPNVGGWQGDTLTEDLDLSYRAQLAGWRIDYCLDLECPAEIPETANAFKSQQRRWAKGSIQVARKLLPSIWKSPLRIGQKVEATLHLTHYSVAVYMLILAVIARPMMAIIDFGKFGPWLWAGWILIIASACAPPLVYGYARISLGQGLSGFRLIPYLVSLGAGLCLNNAIAVIDGIRSRGGVFERTPKSGSVGVDAGKGRYRPLESRMWMMELALGVYCFTSWSFFLVSGKWIFSIFLILYAVGFTLIGFSSMPDRKPRRSESEAAAERARPREPVTPAEPVLVNARLGD